MHSSLTAVQHYMAGFESFREMVISNRAFSGTAVQEAVAGGQLGLPGLRQLLVQYQQQLANIKAVPATA